MMSLYEYLKNVLKIDPDKGAALSIGTDGVSGSSKLMSIGITGPEGNDLSNIYIQGADASKVVQYTGVTVDSYNSLAIPLDLAQEPVMAAVQKADYIVVFNADFTMPRILSAFEGIFNGKQYIDASPVAKFLDGRMPWPAGVSTLVEFQQRLKGCTSHIRGGYSLDALMARVGNYNGDLNPQLSEASPKLERQVYRVYMLWQALLQKGH